MSSSLSLYLLDATATRALIGCRDDRLLDVLRERFAHDLTRDDEYHRDAIERGAPTAEAALHAVVHGGPFSKDRSHAFQYGYAYERLCSFDGAFLPNDWFTPHRGDWLSVVDRGLGALGITAVSVESFGHGGPPAPLPSSFTPACGEWTPDDIARALEQYEAAGSHRTPPQDPEVAQAVAQCLGWMRRAKALPGFGVVGFRS
ncbi:hypothetical protein [Streptomyces sp. NPDC002490]|uniref:DUF7691 family protein n=1 Tax=Streptomyces sp. NPDC002490 TaxID=3154416 RepID=UPI00332254B9